MATKRALEERAKTVEEMLGVDLSGIFNNFVKRLRDVNNIKGHPNSLQARRDLRSFILDNPRLVAQQLYLFISNRRRFPISLANHTLRQLVRSKSRGGNCSSFTPLYIGLLEKLTNEFNLISKKGILLLSAKVLEVGRVVLGTDAYLMSVSGHITPVVYIKGNRNRRIYDPTLQVEDAQHVGGEWEKEFLLADQLSAEAHTTFDKKQVSKSLDILSEAIDLLPEYALLYCNRARTYRLINDFDNSERDCRRAIELEPKRVLPWYQFGLLRVTQGRYEDALRYFENALEINPDSVDSLNSKGATLIELGRREESLECYSEAQKKFKEVESKGLQFLFFPGVGALIERNINLAKLN
jgi:hypothetical protein